MSASDFSRRSVLAAGLAATAAPRFAFASVPTDKRLVIVLLRGAMDGLSAVPAFGDRDSQAARTGIGSPGPVRAHPLSAACSLILSCPRTCTSFIFIHSLSLSPLLLLFSLKSFMTGCC